MTMTEVANEENLRRAFDQVASNDGAPGPDRQRVDEVRERLQAVLHVLKRELLEGTYQPGFIRRVWIPKAGGGQRGLGIPNVVDRVVQQAVLQVLGPHYDPTFHGSSHGFRPGRSCHTAIAEAREHLEEGLGWVVDLDLEKFFDRVNHDRLMSRLEQRIEDPKLLRLIRRMLKAKVVMPEGVVVSTEEGTPQGGPLSPLLSNIVLDELDAELSRRGHRFVRYADDCNIYVRSERAGQRVMASVVRFIERKLKLKVNAAKSAVARPQDRHFLGFSLRREPTDGVVEVVLSKRSRDRIYERIRELTPRTWGQPLRSCILELRRYLLGWLQFFRICTSDVAYTLIAIDGHIRRRLRAILLKQWKRRRTIVRRLAKLRVKASTAAQVVYRGHRSTWRLANNPVIVQTLGVRYFTDQGLPSIAESWRALNPTLAIAPTQLALRLGWLAEEPDVRPTSPVL